MAGQIINDIKKNRIAEYLELGDKDAATKIAMSNSFDPITQEIFLHPEGEGTNEQINHAFKDILNDFFIIDSEIYLATKAYEGLISDTINRMDEIEKSAMVAKEKMMDLNMLCGEESEFFSVKNIDNDTFDSDVIENGLLTLSYEESSPVAIELVEVTGNGFEGNAFVYKNNAFLSDTIDSSLRTSATDSNAATYYEYQRFRAEAKKEETYFAYVNFDGIDISCVLTLKAAAPITTLILNTSDANISLTDVLISKDGLDYASVLKEDVQLNKSQGNYKNESYGYIHQSGLITFPSVMYIKVALSTTSVTSDQIAFMYMDIVEPSSKTITGVQL